MRTLGASRMQMVVVQLAEFLAIGVLSGFIATGGAIALAMVHSDKVVNVPYTFNIWIPLIGIGGGAGWRLPACWARARRRIQRRWRRFGRCMRI